MARRPNGLGTRAYRRADGRWMAKYTDAAGVRHSVYGPTRLAAEAARTDALRRAARGEVARAPALLTVGEHLTRWLAEIVTPGLAPTTAYRYRYAVEQHLAPLLGDKRLAALTPADVQAAINALYARGLAPRTVRLDHALLNGALRVAVEWELIARNPAARARLPKIPAAPRIVLGPATGRALLAALAGHRLEALLTVALTCLLRIGELAALQWGDVDWPARELHVQRGLTRLPGQWIERGTKTDRARRVPFGARVERVLRAHRAAQLAARLRRPDWPRPDLVFTSRTGRPLSRNTIAVKDLPALGAAVGVERLTWHTFRRSGASMLLADGLPVEVVSRMLGHRSVQMTYAAYREILPGELRGAADRLDALLGSETGSDDRNGGADSAE